jgi:hypothetical protein
MDIFAAVTAWTDESTNDPINGSGSMVGNNRSTVSTTTDG